MIVGARGFLGSFVAARAAASFHVARADRDLAAPETTVALDLESPHTIAQAFAEVCPHAVILLSAIADIDKCQQLPELARAVNLHGAELVAEACLRSRARLLFTSTGAVFDGLQHGYTEDDPVSPCSFYGGTKAMAEAAVLARVPDAIIVRPSLVLGRAKRAGTNSLVETLLRRWTAGETVKASAREWRNPIDADTLASWIVALIADPAIRGIFHAGSADVLSRLEIAQRLAALSGIPPTQVAEEPETPAGRAPRGPHHFLLTAKIGRVLGTQPPASDTVLKRSLHATA